MYKLKNLSTNTKIEVFSRIQVGDNKPAASLFKEFIKKEAHQ